MSRDDAIDLVLRALWEAADADSATGGPDALRGDLPGRGHHHRRRLPAASATTNWRTRYEAIAAEVTSTMSMPFYVPPEQVMKDRADFARKGIARGRALVATLFADGIAIVAENPSNTLRKVSEIYDRIAFAGVGRYNEFDQLRVAGVRAADLKGYQYSRDDVDAQSLANNYGHILGQIFTHEMKPMEVEILVAEVGHQRRQRPAVPHPLRRHGDRRAPLQRPRWRRRRDHRADDRRRSRTSMSLARAVQVTVDCARRTGSDAAARPISRSPCCHGPTADAVSVVSPTTRSRPSAPTDPPVDGPPHRRAGR